MGLNLFKNWFGKRERLVKLRYDAARQSKRYSNVVVSTKPADRELTIEERNRIISQCREIQGNFILAGFLLDKHIQYMASYKFQCKTGNDKLDKRIEKLFKRWKRRANCDITGEFSFDELLQMIETHRTTDGDILIVKHGDMKLQLVEGDRVRNPDNIGIATEWLHGLKRNDYGRVLSYAISERLDMGGFKHEKEISANHAWLLAYRRRSDQRRGVTPLVTVINMMTGLYQSFDFALAKERLMQLLGVVTLRDDPTAQLTAKQQKEQEDDDNAFHNEIVEKFGSEIAHLALGKNDKVEVIESQNPSQNTQLFWEMMIRQVLLSLHIPYSFFDGSKTNYYGAEGELNQYLDSCTNRQIPVKEWLHELMEWLITAWYEDGLLELPDGMALEDVFDAIMWSNAGMPYWVMFRLVKEAYTAMMCGAISPQEFANMFGQDYEDNIVNIESAIKFAKEHGVLMSFDMTNRNIIPNLSVSIGG
jgi:capsid protein